MNITFREIDYNNPNDIQAAVTLLNEFNHIIGGSEHCIDKATMTTLKNLGFCEIYLCAYDNEFIGIAVCFIGFSTFKQRKLLNIHDFYIQSKYQARGIGHLFLEYIEKECIKKNYCRITLEVYDKNINAIKLYNKSGFIGASNSEKQNLMYALKKDLE